MENKIFQDQPDISIVLAVYNEELSLAKELEIPYQIIAMSTDYDCWREGEESVSFEMVLKRMSENAHKVKQLLLNAIPKIANQNSKQVQEFGDEGFIKSKIRRSKARHS